MADLDREDIDRIIQRVVAREGLELVHWETVGPRNNLVLRIYIDRPGGVTHGHCEAVSNQVGGILDVEDLIPGSYVLEVSSPGLDRGLYKLSDYERFVGNRVRIRTREPINGQRNFKGRLSTVSSVTVSLDTDGVGLIEIPYENISKANIEHEF